MMNTLNIVLIIIGIYIIYSNFLCKETFAMSPSTLTQLRANSTSSEILNHQLICKDCGSTDIVVNYTRRRNYG